MFFKVKPIPKKDMENGKISIPLMFNIPTLENEIKTFCTLHKNDCITAKILKNTHTFP